MLVAKCGQMALFLSPNLNGVPNEGWTPVAPAQVLWAECGWFGSARATLEYPGRTWSAADFRGRSATPADRSPRFASFGALERPGGRSACLPYLKSRRNVAGG